jgi:hypothetical protein
LIFELLHVTFDFFSNLQHPANYGIWLEITRSQIPGSPHLVHVASSRLLCFHGSSSSVWASKGQLRRLQFDKRVQWHVNWCNMSELNVQIYQSMKNRVCRSALPLGCVVSVHPFLSLQLNLPYPLYSVQYIHPLSSVASRALGHLRSVWTVWSPIRKSSGLPGIGLPRVRIATSRHKAHHVNCLA